jgi:hypothetical protein
MAKKYHNLGGIKDFSGKGFEAKDNLNGSIDKYVQFEDPEVFGMYYVDQIKRNFPNAINTGPDAGAFARGLAAGKRGSYFGVSPDEYEKTLNSFQAAIPKNKMLPFEPVEAAQAGPGGEVPGGEAPGGAAPGQDGLTLVGAPPPGPPPPPYTDTSTADPSARTLYGLVGAGAGTAVSGANAWMQNRDAAAVRRAGLEESARIKARRDETNARTALLKEQQAQVRLDAMKAANPANAASTAAGALPTAAGVATPAGAPPGGLTGGSGPTAQAVRILQGTTGDLGTTGIQRGEGHRTEVAQRSAAQKSQYGKIGALVDAGVVADDAREVFAKLPGMTTTESGILVPRSTPPNYAGPRPGNVWQTREGPKASLYPPAPAAVPAPQVSSWGFTREDLDEMDRMLAERAAKPKPTTLESAKSGLSAVGDLFTNMMKPLEPLTNAAGKALRPLLGPFAGVSAALDAAEIAHEMNKPADQRDAGKIFLKGLSAGTGALSMVPGPQQSVTVPVAIGASGLYEMMYNEDLKNYMRQKLGMTPKVTEPQVTP